jgi:endoglucanase
MLVRTRAGGRIMGVVGSKPPHLMDAEDRKKMVKLKDMFIDIGARSAAEADALGVEIGSFMTLDRELTLMGNGFVTGKALDNRAGLVMMLTALKALKRRKVKATIQAVGTVQEEVGLKGARTSAYGLDPDVAIATDVTIPGDHPGVTLNDSHVEAGKGPVIAILDAGGRGIIAPRSVLRWLRETAEKTGVPYQLGVGNGGTTDATAINITKSVPTRYCHSPVEVLSLRDLEQGAELIAQAVLSAHEYF